MTIKQKMISEQLLGRTKEEIAAILKALGIKEDDKPKQPQQPKEGLVYAVGKSIFLYRPDGKDLLIAKRHFDVEALCSHNSQLYDGGNYNSIYETLNGKEVAWKSSLVFALCSHNGQLYDGNDKTIFNTLRKIKIVKRSRNVSALCSHNGQLFDSEDGQPFDTPKPYAVYETFSNQRVAERLYPIKALCSYNGKLYDAGSSYAIFETFSNKELIKTKGFVTAMCAIPPQIVEQILEKVK